MRYVMFVCVDPEAEKYVREEDNVDDWVAEMDRRKVRRGHRDCRQAPHAPFGRIEIRPVWPAE
jgi:hypothetical protein